MTARWIIALGLLCVGGCARVHTAQNYFHQHMQAKAAYRKSRCGPNECGPYIRHYQRGFHAGYIDVAHGGDGTAPVLPPKQYATFKYRGPDGPAAVNSWFGGFRDGACVALQDGVQQYHYMTSSPCYDPCYGEPCPENCDCPVPAFANRSELGSLPQVAGQPTGVPVIPAAANQIRHSNHDRLPRLPPLVEDQLIPAGFSDSPSGFQGNLPVTAAAAFFPANRSQPVLPRPRTK